MSRLPTQPFHHGRASAAAAAVIASDPTTPAMLDAEDARARAILLALVEPADQNLAMLAMDDAAVKAQKAADTSPKTAEARMDAYNAISTSSHAPTLLFSSSPSSPLAIYCNAFLCSLARAHTTPLLDKAFAYLGKMRAISPEELGDGVIPSALARNNLIRTCAIVIRGVGLDGIDGGGRQRQQQWHPSASHPPSDITHSRADSKKYVGLGEMLFEEYLQSAHEAIRRQPTNHALLQTYQTDTPPLLSSTIYLYFQAREFSKTITIFQRMREQFFPCPIIPDAWATSGVIRAHAHNRSPLEAWSLLQDLTQGPLPVEVILLPGLYKSLAHGIQRQLAQSRHPMPQALELRRLAHRLLRHMRHVAKLRPPLTLWRVFMKIEARFGDWRRVQRYMAVMKEYGWVSGSHEYAILIEALGEGKALKVLAHTQEKMRREGVPFTYVVYLSIIQAHRKSYDLRGAQAAFEAFIEEPTPRGGKGEIEEEMAQRANPMEVVTAMMKVYAQAGLPQKAWDLFCQFREGRIGGGGGREGGVGGKGGPDHVMYSVALRVASNLGGVPMVEKLYKEHRGQVEVEGGAGTEVGLGLVREGGDGESRKMGGMGWGDGGMRRGSATGKGKDMTLHSVLAAYVDAGQWEKAWAMFDGMVAAERAEGGALSIQLYNVLLHGLIRSGRHEEARTLAERARAEGVEFDAVTMKILAKAVGAEELWTPPAHVYVLGGMRDREEEAGDEEEEGKEEWGRRSVPADTVVLDLHRLSVQEAHNLLARTFEVLRSRYDAEVGGEGREREKTRKDKNQTEDRTENKEKEMVGMELKDEGGEGVQDLLLITGFRRRVGPGQGAALLADKSMPVIDPCQKDMDDGNALQVAVREFLGAREIYWSSPPSNPGRLNVQKASLQQYFDRQRKAESEVKFFRLTLFRYIPVASLMALFFLVPKDGLPL